MSNVMTMKFGNATDLILLNEGKIGNLLTTFALEIQDRKKMLD